MDYEVFLLSRVREHWLRTGDSTQAVAEGLAASAGTISSAALILVCVFAVFVGTGLPIIKELGLGAAVAIGVDATLIRLILVPATMELFGRWNWWLPRPLERLVAMSNEAMMTTNTEKTRAEPKQHPQVQ
jgi:RND superfamily putative drug exporter